MTETDVDGTDLEGWEELAERLTEDGGVPETRAKAVALVASGATHAQTADVLETSSGNIYNMLDTYHEKDLGPARWLAEHGPIVIDGRVDED